MTAANDLAVRRALEAPASNSLMAMAVGPGCACGRRINRKSANKDPSLPHALGSCWQGVHGGQFRLLLDKRIGDAVTFAVHGGGSLFGVSAIKLVAIGDQLSTFEFGHAQARGVVGEGGDCVLGEGGLTLPTRTLPAGAPRQAQLRRYFFREGGLESRILKQSWFVN
jgi:hypothetical protein